MPGPAWCVGSHTHTPPPSPAQLGLRLTTLSSADTLPAWPSRTCAMSPSQDITAGCTGQAASSSKPVPNGDVYLSASAGSTGDCSEYSAVGKKFVPTANSTWGKGCHQPSCCPASAWHLQALPWLVPAPPAVTHLRPCNPLLHPSPLYLRPLPCCSHPPDLSRPAMRSPLQGPLPTSLLLRPRSM